MALDSINDSFKREMPKDLDDDYIKDTIAERDAIPLYIRYAGMRCYVLDRGDGQAEYYILKAGSLDDLSDNTKWEPLASAPEPTVTNAKYIIYGGAEWSGTGLVFNTSEIQYDYYGTIDIIAPDSVTLDDGDAEDRFDIIAVKQDTNSIAVLKGIPSDNPLFPEIPEEYIAIQPVLVKTGATTPDITQIAVYQENEEWVTSTLGTLTGTVDFEATADPIIGSKYVKVAACNRNAIIVFTSNTGNVLYADAQLLTLKIRVTSVIPSNANLVLRNRFNGNNSGTAVSLNSLGFNPTLINSVQSIVIPTSYFNAAQGNGLSLQLIHGSVNLNMSWDLDNILFSLGQAPVPPPEPPSGDVIQSITITTANTTVNLENGNIIYANAQADSEIDVTNIVVGKKYSFIFSMPAPTTRAITFNTDRFYADGGFDPVELTTGYVVAKEVVVVECIGLTATALALRARSDVKIEEGGITNIIQNSQYVQQVSYVDTTGDDETGKVNDSDFPFASIKAAVDSLTAAICSIRIGTGVYECPVEVLQDIDPRVQSLTMESHATTINATADFVKANQTTLYEFRFFGSNTDIVSGYFGFAIEGSNIYNLELVTKNITGNQSGLVLIHPGFNNVVINGNLTGGTGTGTALTIRGANNSKVYITGDISSSGSGQFSNCIDVRQVKGNLDISWGGTLYTTNLTDFRSNAIRFDSFNSSSNVTFKGNILDDKPSQFLGTILILHNFGNFSHEGNITVTSGNIIRVQQNHTNKCSLSFKGELKALDGRILYSEGTLRDMDVYFDLKDSSFASQGFYLAGAIRLHLNGNITGSGGETSLFAFPAIVPDNIKIFIDDVTFEASEITVPIISPATVTSGTANIKVLGTLRSNSTEEIPEYAGLIWLTDLTANPGNNYQLHNYIFEADVENEYVVPNRPFVEVKVNGISYSESEYTLVAIDANTQTFSWDENEFELEVGDVISILYNGTEVII